MKINVGIVGYGNLGQALEKLIFANKNYNLVAIFSRRNVVSKYRTIVEKYENFKDYKRKINLMFLCGGSRSDLELQTPEILEYFDCINTFDNHAKIESEFTRLNIIGKNFNHRLIMSCGWDPGIFSIIRGLFKAIGDNMPVTFWGKGISMGHSDAIRRIDGVIDGVEFTIPNPDAVLLARHGQPLNDLELHYRDCYVVARQGKEKDIETNIKNIPNYFLNQKTTVNFVSSTNLNALKKRLSHKGKIIERFSNFNNKYNMEFSVSMDSNPEFTAKIMIAYANAINRLSKEKKSGAFTALDIPISYLFENDKVLFKFC